MADTGQNDASVLFGNPNLSAPAAQPAGVSISPSSEEDASLLFGKRGVGRDSSALGTTPVSFTPHKSEDSNILFGSSSLSELHQPAPPTQIQAVDSTSAPDDPWYKKAWDFANNPLFDEKSAKNWFGWDVEHWSGWGRGLFDLASGLTSPLSVALAIGTFGTSALESLGIKAAVTGGEAALRGTMGAEDIAQVVKGSGVLTKAIKMGANVDTAYAAMPSFGIDPQIVAQGLETLAKQGMKPESLLADGLIRKTGGSMLRAAGVDIAQADKIANWTQFAIDGGFTAQNAYAAAIAAPRVLDAIKEGDYETAKRLAVDAIGSGAFAFLGGRAAHQHAGELMTETEAALGLRVKPSDENLKLIKLLEPIERERIIAGEREKQWEESTRKDFKDGITLKRDSDWVAGGSSESDLRARFYRESEGRESRDNMAAWHDAIAEAADRPEEKIVKEETAVTSGAKAQADTDFYSQAKAEWVQKNPQGGPASMKAISEIAGRAQELKASGAPRDNGFPPDVQEWIDSKKLKDKPKEYVDQLLKASDPRLLTEKEIEYSKHVGDHFDESGERAVGEEALTDLIDAYVTRVWKDPENDTIRKFRSVGRSSGDMSVNTAMARKRVFQSTLEGILRGNDLSDHDMVALAAHNGNEFSSIVAHRQGLRRIRGSNARASDGRPMAALSGSGHVIESTNAEGETVNPATVINPKAMQSIRMADKVVDGLKNQIHRPEAELTKPTAGQTRIYRPQGEQKWFSSRDEARSAGDKIEYVDVPQAESDYYLKGTDRRTGARSLSLDDQIGFKNRFSELRQEIAEAKTPEEKATAQRRLDELQQIVKDKQQGLSPKPLETRPAVTQIDQLIKEGRVVKFGVDRRGRELYGWTTHDYKTVDNPNFRGWKVPTVDTDGNPIYVQGELKVHPEAHEYLQRRFGADQSIVKKVPGLKTVLAAAREAKGLLLFVSPFHVIQEGLRAIMTGISPIGLPKFDSTNPMHVLAAEKGVWEFKDYKGVRAFEDGLTGHSKVLAKVPLLRELQAGLQTFLFDRYIPALKLRAFESLYGRYNETYGKVWTKEKIATKTANDVNNRFGGLDYKRMGRSAGTMDVSRIMALAPDWLESEVRFMGSMFGDEGKIVRRDVARMAVIMWGAARVLNYLVSGKPHNEAPLGVAWTDDEGREKVYSLRSMPGDMLHAVSDPVNFINGRVAPLGRVAAETFLGRDEYGRKLTRNGIFVNLLRNVSPIPVQSAIKAATGESPDINPSDSAVKAAGFTVYNYRTQGQRLAAQLASSHTETGEVDKAKLRRYQGMIELENRLRLGKVPVTDLYKAVEEGQIHPDEARKMLKTVKETEGLDPDSARFYAHVSRLPIQDILQIWDNSSAEEHALIAKIFVRKATNYFKKVAKEMSPAERQSDLVYNRLRKMLPQATPF